MRSSVATIDINEKEEDIWLFNTTEKQLNIIEKQLIQLYKQDHVRSDDDLFSDVYENIKIVRALLQYPIEKIDHLFFRDLKELVANIETQYRELVENNKAYQQMKDAMRTVNVEANKSTWAKILNFPTKNNPPIKQHIIASNEKFHKLFEEKRNLIAHKKICWENEEIRPDMNSKVIDLIEYRKSQINFIENATQEQKKAIQKIVKAPGMGELRSDLNIIDAANDMKNQIEKEEIQKTPEKPSSFWWKVKSGLKNLFGK